MGSSDRAWGERNNHKRIVPAGVCVWGILSWGKILSLANFQCSPLLLLQSQGRCWHVFKPMAGYKLKLGIIEEAGQRDSH